MDQFPETIEIRLLDEYTQMPLSKIAVQIKLFASRKNDYVLMLPLSDQNGYVSISKDWIRSKINDLQSFFVMDYTSMLEDCKPQIEFSVPDGELLKEKMHLMDSFRDTTRTVDPGIYRDAMNGSYLPMVILIELKDINSMKIEFTLKSRQ